MNFFGKLLLSVLFVGFAALAHTGLLDSKGEHYAEQGLSRALIAFGIARGLNGVISVAQGTEFAVQPAGIGVNFTPGQILDPVNDLIERFSWVMLAASASLGIQQTLLTIASWPYFSYLMVGLFLSAAAAVWLPAVWRSKVGRYFIKFAIVFVFVRFAVSLAAISSELVYVQFLAPQYEQATAQLEATTADISRINSATREAVDDQDEELSLLDRAKRMYSSAKATLDIDARIEQYKTAAADASKSAVNLVVVFVFQTIVFPLLFIAVIYTLAKSLLRFDRS